MTGEVTEDADDEDDLGEVRVAAGGEETDEVTCEVTEDADNEAYAVESAVSIGVG